QPVAPPYLSFFFQATAPTEIYTLSLHDALPIFPSPPCPRRAARRTKRQRPWTPHRSTSWFPSHGPRPCPRPRRAISPSWSLPSPDRKSTRLNSSHVKISYAVFCLKKKNTNNRDQ